MLSFSAPFVYRAQSRRVDFCSLTKGADGFASLPPLFDLIPRVPSGQVAMLPAEQFEVYARDVTRTHTNAHTRTANAVCLVVCAPLSGIKCPRRAMDSQYAGPRFAASARN
jgi:hypothetical protein